MSLLVLFLACTRTVRTFRMLDDAERLWVNPACAACIRVGKILASLLTMILERLLESKFRREIGLYELGSVGHFPFLAISLM